MKKTKSEWWQPEGWMQFGTWALIGAVVIALVLLVWLVFLPKLRTIGKIYNSARGETTRVAARWQA